jgi:hypothetical protein
MLKDIGAVVGWNHLTQVGSSSCGRSNEPSHFAKYGILLEVE